jgi:hypothetical protein
MNKRRFALGAALLAAAALTLVVQGCATTENGLEHALRQRYTLSRIEIENDRRQGAVTRQGTMLVLQEDGIPANELRVFRPLIHSPRSHIPNPARHLRNYARVEIDPNGTRTAEAAAFHLPRGTRLVVLDLRIEADRIRVFTHTAEPVSAGPSRTAYGHTEFVFRLEPRLLQARDPAPVQQVIERWLRVEPGGRASEMRPPGGGERYAR